MIWKRIYGGATADGGLVMNFQSFPSKIVADQNGNIIFSGRRQTGSTATNDFGNLIFVAKLNPRLAEIHTMADT